MHSSRGFLFADKAMERKDQKGKRKKKKGMRGRSALKAKVERGQRMAISMGENLESRECNCVITLHRYRCSCVEH